MPKPRDTNPSPAAIRMREYRERLKASPTKPKTHGRLVCLTLWVPKGDEKALQTHAQKLRHMARIPESEVPE